MLLGLAKPVAWKSIVLSVLKAKVRGLDGGVAHGFGDLLRVIRFGKVPRSGYVTESSADVAIVGELGAWPRA